MSKKVDYKHFQYASDACKWINENNIKVLSICDAGRFSEGVNVFYYKTKEGIKDGSGK